MPSVNSLIQFKYGLQANYDLIEAKDANTIYFTTDSQRMFVGDIEMTRPVKNGTELPSTFLPPQSFFVKETGTKRELYYSKNGDPSTWELVSILPAQITGGVFGTNAKTQLEFGDSFVVPELTVDNYGFITVGKNQTLTLPDAPADASVTVTPGTEGNVVTSVVKGSGATEIIINKSTIEGSGSVTGNATTFVTGVTLGADFELAGTTQAADTDVSTGTSIPTTAAVKSYVDTQDAATLQDAKDYADSILGANDAMLFKGTVGGASSGATVTDFEALTDYKTGWTYRVIEAGTYAGVDCEIGDLLIAVTDYSDAFDDADWTVAQTNIDGAVISDAALASGNIVTGAGGQKVQDSGVSLATLQGTINNKVDKVTTGVAGNIVEFGAGGAIADSGVATDSLATAASVTALEGRVGTAESDIDNLQAVTIAGKALSGAVTIALDDLSDVAITSPEQGNGLVYDATTSTWKNGPVEADSVDWANVQSKPTISLTGDVTGSINLETGAAVTTAIGAGVIVNADISASAAIDQSKINGLTTALAGKLDVDGKANTAGTADQVLNALTIKLNGTATSPATFNGSAALEVDITPAAIGAQVAGTYLTPDSSLNAAKLTGAIPASVTAATASVGDSSTAIATTAFVSNAVSSAALKWGTF